MMLLLLVLFVVMGCFGGVAGYKLCPNCLEAECFNCIEAPETMQVDLSGVVGSGICVVNCAANNTSYVVPTDPTPFPADDCQWELGIGLALCRVKLVQVWTTQDRVKVLIEIPAQIGHFPQRVIYQTDPLDDPIDCASLSAEPLSYESGPLVRHCDFTSATVTITAL